MGKERKVEEEGERGRGREREGSKRRSTGESKE